MAYSKDQLILRDGQAASGKVLDKEFKIKTSFATLTLKKSKIVHIHFMRPDGTGFPPADQIKTNNGDDLYGKILQPKIISFVLATNGQLVKIHRDKINTLVFLDSLDEQSANYPKITL